MRFHEHGPDIPDELLVARDEGNVLFFCGAGVSLANAKLADFLTLAKNVIDDLGSLTGSQARRLYDAARPPSGAKSYVPVDRMFSSLDLEFEPREVRDAVAQALTPKPDADLRAHRTLIDLSRGADGRPRLITTNFDRLFEACDPALKSWGPSKLPLPDRPVDFEGIIHVHGRVDEDYAGISEAVVLSSADFGKAYLSDGWATHYIRSLMNRFKIVFVGYSADDPPVQYLLEALREEQSPVANVYAFQFGGETDAQEQWLQKGVVPIAFGSQYSNLWDTLEAWADRARDVDAWRRETIAGAAGGPAEASPVFRGKIAHLASTAAGMKTLLTGEPALPATWLYVFDPHVRYLKSLPLKRFDSDAGTFDCFGNLGLDCDEAPTPIDPDNPHRDREVPKSAWNAFMAHPPDLDGIAAEEAGSFFGRAAMPPRLWLLARFLINRMNETPALWWAAGLRAVHPNLARGLEQHLRYQLKNCNGKLPQYWRYLLALWKEPEREPDLMFYHIQDRVKSEGWSTRLIREAVALSRPVIIVNRASGIAPPMAGDADPAEFLTLDVEYPAPHEDFDFQAADLPFVTSLWRGLLVEAEQMETEIGAYISLDTTRPNDGEKPGGGAYGLTRPLIRFTQLMEALEASDKNAARKEVRSWDTYDGLVFERLSIWAAGRAGLMPIEDAESVFTTMSDRTFWGFEHERDLLYSIRDRWAEMSERSRALIEARILQAPISQFDGYEPDEAKQSTAHVRLNVLQWLSTNRIEFGFDISAEMRRLRAIAPSWREEAAEYTAQPRIGPVRSVKTDNDPSSILDFPPSRLLPIEAGERRGRDYTEHDPFAGYSVKKPASAILALHSAMRRNVETAWRYWHTFLRATSETATTQRQNAIVVALIRKVPPDDIARFWYPLIEWLSRRANRFEARRQGEFDAIWDKVIEAANLHPSVYKQKPGRDWAFEALNAVAGRLVNALMNVTLPEGQTEVPATWIARLTTALKLPGDHARHALYHVARNTNWFYFHQKAWMEEYVLPFASDNGPNGDVFWAGFSGMHYIPDPELLVQLKPAMLARVGSGGRAEQNLVGYLLSGWGSKRHDQIVSDAELRDMLILGDHTLRQAVLNFVGDWAADALEWRDMVLPFINRIWPKQRTVRTPEMSAALLRFASRFPDQFAAILAVVNRRLVTVSGRHNLHLKCEVAALDEEATHALIAALEKLLPDERSAWPYNCKEIIDALAASGRAPGPSLDGLVRRAAEREF
ncbi:SIR2 family protein [Rhizobium leguminosarum]|uniref:SIR2 family protein n=1 Tax=Rhizobium leguminosarum TaxID=384 RepID=UPI0003657EB3|nr:SIR2 family protein [Rhizobium leguminosarum]